MHPSGYLAEELRRHGLGVFLGDRAWPDFFGRQLRACRAVAVCLGPEGFGPWQRREQYVAPDCKARKDAFPVIPVLLCPAPRIRR